jgi:hypothetical protein
MNGDGDADRKRQGPEPGPHAPKPRRGLPVEQTIADDLPSVLPRWRIRHPDRAAEPGRDRRAATDGREFQADRRAARYAPARAVFVVRGRGLPVLTVSMSGLAVEWDDLALPAIGTTVDGELQTGAPDGVFHASMQVVRLEPARRLAAGRFVGLAGSAIDRLLNWLVDLERSAAGRD